jgi:hypothetical protein
LFFRLVLAAAFAWADHKLSILLPHYPKYLGLQKCTAMPSNPFSSLNGTPKGMRGNLN